MTEQIAAALRRGRLRGYEIEIDVQGGHVTLSGTVQTEAGRLRAAELASRVDGISLVINNLTVISGN